MDAEDPSVEGDGHDTRRDPLAGWDQKRVYIVQTNADGTQNSSGPFTAAFGTDPVLEREVVIALDLGGMQHSFFKVPVKADQPPDIWWFPARQIWVRLQEDIPGPCYVV